MIRRLYDLALEAEDLNPLTFDEMDENIDNVLEVQYQVDYSADGIEQAVVAAHQLTKIADVVDTHSEDDSHSDVMDTRILDVVLENIYQQLGVRKPRELSMEDAEGMTWGDRATRIKEQLYQILQAIIEALRRAYQNLRSYLNKILSAAATLERYAAQQKRRYRSLSGEPTQATYESARLAKALYCPDAGLIMTFERLFDLVEAAEESANSGYVPLVAEMVQKFVDGGDIDHLVSEFSHVFSKTFSNIFKHGENDEIIKAFGEVEGSEVYTSQYLPGAYLAVMTVPNFTENLGKFLFAIKRPIDKEDLSPELKVLSPHDISEFLSSVIKSCAKIRRFDMIEKRNGSLVDQLTQATQKLKKSTHEVSDKDKLFLKSLASIAPSLARGIHQQTFTFALSSYRSLVEHCDKSAQFYTTPT